MPAKKARKLFRGKFLPGKLRDLKEMSYICPRINEAAIAQLVERFTRNEEVPSSSLGCGSAKTVCYQAVFLF